MKKLFSALMACALIVSMAPAALALSLGDMVVKDDDDYYTESAEPIAPGSTFWVYLDDAYDGNGSKLKEPKNIKIEEVEVIDSDTGKEVKLLSVDSKPDFYRYGSDSKHRAYYARVTVKSVSASSYPKDGYDVANFEITFTNSDGNADTTGNLAPFSIEYEEADDEFEDDPKMFSFDKDDDIEIDLPYSSGTFTGIARKDFDIIAAMDTKVDSSLLNKYPNADMEFFNGNGANFPVTSGKLTFYADSGDYLYEVSGSTLTDRSNTYSSSKNAFVVNTTTIGKYILSDTKLSGASAGGSTSSTTSSSTPASSSQGEYIGTTPPPSTTPPVTNPNTGARA